LRRYLGSADVSAFASVLGNVLGPAGPPAPTLRDRALTLLADGETRFNVSIGNRKISEKEKPLLNAGRWSVAVIIDPPKSDAVADQAFLNTIASSNPRLTGWAALDRFEIF
jgi:hypothetical protein